MTKANSSDFALQFNQVIDDRKFFWVKLSEQYIIKLDGLKNIKNEFYEQLSMIKGWSICCNNFITVCYIPSLSKN